MQLFFIASTCIYALAFIIQLYRFYNYGVGYPMYLTISAIIGLLLVSLCVISAVNIRKSSHVFVKVNIIIFSLFILIFGIPFLDVPSMGWGSERFVDREFIVYILLDAGGLMTLLSIFMTLWGVVVVKRSKKILKHNVSNHHFHILSR